MLVHTYPLKAPKYPERIVILGAGGFVGKAIDTRFRNEGLPTRSLAKKDLDLLDPSSTDILTDVLTQQDTLIICAAVTPTQSGEVLEQNIRIMNHILPAIKKVRPFHIIYISSDEVYSDSKQPLSEDSPAEPSSLLGVAHLAREVMLKSLLPEKLAIIRPTRIYGTNDPHNAYGPNRFVRLALQGQEIRLYGRGEELRDHIYIGDVAELVFLLSTHASSGILNAVTGRVQSFHEIAKSIVSALESTSEIIFTERSVPIPHDGYRAFDIAELGHSFPAFKPMRFEAGIEILREIKPPKIVE